MSLISESIGISVQSKWIYLSECNLCDVSYKYRMVGTDYRMVGTRPKQAGPSSAYTRETRRLDQVSEHHLSDGYQLPPDPGGELHLAGQQGQGAYDGGEGRHEGARGLLGSDGSYLQEYLNLT